MTQEAKHALIAEKIEGWQRHRKFPHWPCGKERAYPRDTVWLLPDGNIRSGRWGLYPDYSADLNLCARAEKRIAEMGIRVSSRSTDHPFMLYTWLLMQALGIRAFDNGSYRGNPHDFWPLLTAPAESRVDAMVRLIESGALETRG